MSENGDSTAGRVTRSLRKRITSIDSDASSRPGTPIVNNLQTISETATPSKRITRRTSISTPLATPSKAKVRLDSVEVSNSPARRTTRRRSVSMQEQELMVQIKSKEPTIDAVKEEEIAEKTPEHRRVTRSSSKSPLEVHILQSKLNTPKAKKNSIEHEEVINLDDSLESLSQPIAATPPITRSTKQTKVRIKKEKNIDEMVHASPKNLSQLENKNASTRKEDDVPEEEVLSKSTTEQKTPPTDSKLSTLESNTEQAASRKSDIDQKQTRISNVELRSSPRMNVSLEKKDPATETLSDTARAHVEDGSPQKRKIRPENLKNVAFDETIDEDTIKSVYPKTPGLPKSKSYILDSSKDLEIEPSSKSTEEKLSDKGVEEDEDNVTSVETYKPTLKTMENSTPTKSASPMKNKLFALEEQTKESVAFNNSTDGHRKSISGGEKDGVLHEYNETLNIYKLKSKTIESSTPIKFASPKKNKSPRVESESAKENGDTEAVTVFPKSWTHSVSGTVNEAAKIDSIRSEESMKKQLEEDESLKKTKSFTSQNGSKQKRNVFDDSDDDSDDLLEEDDYDEDMEEEDERNQEKSIFIDDEAMEVPEGEESMDSEERQYLEENEIPVYGESIGSEDSEDNEDEEEDQEDDDGFIVSDSEDVVLAADEFDSNDEIEELENSNKKKKTYKRIMKYSESSNEADNRVDVEDKDFRLIMDSSLEDGKTKQQLDSSKRDDVDKISGEEESSHTETVEKGTPNQRNSQGDEEDTDKVNEDGDLDNALKINTPSKSMYLKETEEEVQETNSGTLNAQEDGKKRTPNRRKSLHNDEVEKGEYGGRTSKVDTPNKRMSLKNTEDEHNEPNTDKEEEELDKKTRKNPLNKSDVGTEPKRLSKSERKSLNNSKASKSMQESVSDVEMAGGPTEEADTMSCAKNTRKSLNKSKPDIPQSENDFEEHVQTPSHNHHNEEETAVEITNTSMNESRKSLKTFGTPKQNKNASRKSARMSLKSDSESCQSESIESTKIDKNTSLNQSRKSLDNTEKVSKDITRKSLPETEPEDKESFEREDLNVSRKSLTDPKNIKRETLTRNSTEEENEEEELQSLHRRFLNKSKLENTFQCYDEGGENEETLTASEVPSEASAGRSLNLSKRSRKSLNRSKNDDIPSQDDEPESTETDLEKPERKSLNRQISLKVYSESEEEKDDENDDEARFSEEEQEEEPKEYHRNAAEKSAVMEFLGEEVDTSRSPPQRRLNSSRRTSGNDSKLDETFQLESNTNPVCIHDSLHRSIMRKSLNQSKLLQEPIEENKNMSESEEDTANYLVDTSEEEQVYAKKELPERGLSVSLSNIEFKNKTMKDKAIRNSFTIGVSVRNPSSAHKSSSSPSSTTNECGGGSDEHVLSEQEDLENVKNVHSIEPFKPRKSLSTSLIRCSPLISEDNREKKRLKRTSLYLQEESASQSFVENITKEKQKADLKRKRQSNSFCGVLAPSVEKEPEQEIPKSERKPKPSSESENQINIQRILSRCDEILEAANLAKREAKLHSKKSKVKKPKWMDKEEKAPKEENEVKIPLVSRKELKRKEKIKKELAKAIKHSTAMLKIIDPKLGKERKVTQAADVEQTHSNPSSTKRLPTEFLEALDVPLPKQKKSKELQLTPPSDKENSKKSSNKGVYSKSDISADKKKKKREVEILKTASGTVIVEPSTPKKLRFQHGFRESPKTPIGFKIQDIHSAGQSEREKSRKHAKKLFTPSGEFIEEDLSISNAKTNSKKAHKRKRHIEEPVYSLPKTQWTPSGMFVEEDLYGSRPLANSTATQFMVTSLNGGKKTKNSSTIVSLATLNKAMSFKQSALFNDKVRRETSRELIHRKQRKLANNQY